MITGIEAIIQAELSIIIAARKTDRVMIDTESNIANLVVGVLDLLLTDKS